ncbi:hypothetical protein B0H13DRAFT_1930231 [Mycena leptocephala]|nr:hypothetical protein B0H13DRAFT_1930231 [Mycena leptocephala]
MNDSSPIPYIQPACRRTFEIWENYCPNSSHIPAPSITSPKGNAVLFYSVGFLARRNVFLPSPTNCAAYHRPEESLAERKTHRIMPHVPPSRPVGGVFPSPPKFYANFIRCNSSLFKDMWIKVQIVGQRSGSSPSMVLCARQKAALRACVAKFGKAPVWLSLPPRTVNKGTCVPSTLQYLRKLAVKGLKVDRVESKVVAVEGYKQLY